MGVALVHVDDFELALGESMEEPRDALKADHGRVDLLLCSVSLVDARATRGVTRRGGGRSR